jgi:hypothetical protein
MTTAEPPEPLTIQHADSIMNKQNLLEIVGPAARHSCPVVSISGSHHIDFVAANKRSMRSNINVVVFRHIANGDGAMTHF